QRMYEVNIEELHDKEYFISSILSAAFLDDLFYGIPDIEQQAWLPKTCIVLFLDGFEALLNESGSVGLHLLETLLPTAYYRRGEAHPLLIITGSQMRLIDRSRIGGDPPFEQSTDRESKYTASKYAQGLHNRWLSRVRAMRSVL